MLKPEGNVSKFGFCLTIKIFHVANQTYHSYDKKCAQEGLRQVSNQNIT